MILSIMTFIYQANDEHFFIVWTSIFIWIINSEVFLVKIKNATRATVIELNTYAMKNNEKKKKRNSNDSSSCQPQGVSTSEEPDYGPRYWRSNNAA